MAEFCTCGSLKIEGNCTNKNCANKISAKPATRAGRTKAAGTAAKALKTKPETAQARSRRSSKCITYNMYDVKEPEENIEESVNEEDMD